MALDPTASDDGHSPRPPPHAPSSWRTFGAAHQMGSPDGITRWDHQMGSPDGTHPPARPQPFAPRPGCHRQRPRVQGHAAHRRPAPGQPSAAARRTPP
eukprot:4612156-Prymnesium_polylepis.1